MPPKSFGTYLSELTEATSLGAGDRIPVLESGTTKYVDGGDIGGGGGGGASYLVYTALLSQSGTDDPVATVLENTLGGTVVWTRDDAGAYTGSLAGAFTANKTFSFATGSSGLTINPIGPNDVNSIALINLQLFPSAEPSDDFTASVEIRVYP